MVAIHLQGLSVRLPDLYGKATARISQIVGSGEEALDLANEAQQWAPPDAPALRAEVPLAHRVRSAPVSEDVEAVEKVPPQTSTRHNAI